MGEETSSGFSSGHINSRLIFSAEDIPQSTRWESQNETGKNFEIPHSEKETGFYHDRGAEFSWSVPRASGRTDRNRQRYRKQNRSTQTRGLWDSARSFLQSDKVWLTTHSTVEVQPTDVHFKCSNAQTFMNLIKGSTGTGILTLPLAFMNAGLWALIYVMQCSFCCVFIVWMAVNVKNVLDQAWPDSPDVRVYEFVIFLLLLPYVMISDLRILSIFSALANVLYMVSLVIICQFLFQDLPDASKRPGFKSWGNMPLFLGAAVYCFECICLVIPLRGRMRREEDMGGWTGLLTLTETVVVAVDTAIGFYGYLKFGESTASTITLNLPQGRWLYRSVTLMFAASVFFSLAVQFYVPVAVLWPAVDAWLTKHWSSGYNRTLAECLTRAGLLTFILIFAVLVPHIDLLVELIGSLFGCLLSMIVPALVEIIIMCGVTELNFWTLSKDIIIIFVGVSGMVCGTYTSMLDIIESF
ncbi:proton-coupled amino acid transporter [Elysia marginata]|uniref:Proton-coupled amino acid transporter n=1 Tax=Elysia marginata TaxID=1093978 RepID=A0AAV4HDR2_9GAST|nr:proton-coupled amino acid transporter [Elysia marginata]